MPLRSIVSNRGTVSYETAKELARILKPLVGRSAYHVHNTRDFVQHKRCIQLQPDECIMSYDVKALFTSLPIGPAINIIKKHLEEDKELQQSTSITVSNIIRLLEFCTKNTYFLFQGWYYEQLEGAAKEECLHKVLERCSTQHGLTLQSHSGKFIYGRFWDQSS